MGWRGPLLDAAVLAHRLTARPASWRHVRSAGITLVMIDVWYDVIIEASIVGKDQEMNLFACTES